MLSTFHGIEVSKRGMFTQKGALYTVSQNIANANTPGYSRQRVNFSQTEAFPPIGMNRPMIPGQMGTGVEAQSVQRVREAFLDTQYRTQNSQVGYWEAKDMALSKMEDIVKEPSKSGLGGVMTAFWQSLQDLSVNPQSSGPRSVVLERAKSVADTMHYYHDSLVSIKKDLGTELKVSLKDANSLIQQIASVNDQIHKVEPNGYLPNDLYDQRDVLVDQLAKLVNIGIDRIPSGGDSPPMAEGMYQITMLDDDGKPIMDSNGNGITLVGGTTYSLIGLKEGPDNATAVDSDGDGVLDEPTGDYIVGLTIDTYPEQTDIPPPSIPTTSESSFDFEQAQVPFSPGRLRGIIEGFGYQTDQTGSTGEYGGSFPTMLNDYDKFAYSFGLIFNSIHGKGYQMDAESQGNPEFFTGLSGDETPPYKGAAKNIGVGITDPAEIAAANRPSAAGDGSNALNLTRVKNSLLDGSNVELLGPDGPDIVTLDSLNVIGTGTLDSFYEAITGGLGVNRQQSLRLSTNTNVLLQSVERNRNSVSSVSVDEEMTDMVKFQQAYNASARCLTAMDELLDKVINNMGRVGL